jgi:hypothetical protein
MFDNQHEHTGGMVAGMPHVRQALLGVADRVHVPQVAAAVPEGIRLEKRQRCVVCTSDEAALKQALSTCAYRYSSLVSHVC